MFAKKISIFWIVLILATVACGAGPSIAEQANGAPTYTALPTYTQSAATIPSTATLYPTQTPYPTFTGVPTEKPATLYPTQTPYPTFTSVPTANAKDACGARNGLITFVPVKDNTHGQWDKDVSPVAGLPNLWRDWSPLGPEAPHDPWIFVFGDPKYSGGLPDFVHAVIGEVVISNNTDLASDIYFVIIRDPDGTDEAYRMALANDLTDKTQDILSIYFKGSASIMNDDCQYVELNDDWYQTILPIHYLDGWIFRVHLDPGEYLKLWQGAVEWACPSGGCIDIHSPFELPIWVRK